MIYINMDLALNDLQRLYAKKKTTNQPTNQLTIRKGMHPTVLCLSMGKLQWRLSSLTLKWQLVQEK